MFTEKYENYLVLTKEKAPQRLLAQSMKCLEFGCIIVETPY